MTEMVMVSSAIFGGFALGIFFFVGLWWTVQRGVISPQPAVVFFGSMVLRTLVVMVGFYSLSRGDWRNVSGSLIGFVLARFFITRNARFSFRAKALVASGVAR